MLSSLPCFLLFADLLSLDGLPVAGEKTCSPAVVIIPLLGTELDSQQMVLRLLQEKLLKLRTLEAKRR